MNTLEGNKMIAEFMGIRVITDEELQYDFDNPRLNVWNIGSIRYHSSWDWLMPVVEKIERVFADNYLWFDISANEVFIHDETNLVTFRSGKSCSNKFTAIYDAVVQFIQWYNSQSKNIEK